MAGRVWRLITLRAKIHLLLPFIFYLLYLSGWCCIFCGVVCDKFHLLLLPKNAAAASNQHLSSDLYHVQIRITRPLLKSRFFVIDAGR